MSAPSNPDDLRASLAEALDLLRDYGAEQRLPAAVDPTPLPSLLAQCEAFCAAAPDPAPVGSVHHFACSGGTLISKCLAAMPNVTLLSEIDPLSRMQIAQEGKRLFLPTDLIYAARTALRPVDEAAATAMFLAALEALRRDMQRSGRHLVLRDHAHSQFCSDTAPAGRATLHEILQQGGPVRSLVTVRHPLDCFLSLKQNRWEHFSPFTLEEYARRHLVFLDRHAGLPVFAYETFVSQPEAELERMCAVLGIPYAPGAEDLIPVVVISGDSGRSSGRIEPRDRRPVPPELRAAADASPSYQTLCARLDYRP